MPIVNGHQAETGCYVEGHWGQYGPDHLADQAEGFGWPSGADNMKDPRICRQFADALEDCGSPDLAATLWQWHSEAADAIETWLNDHTPDICLACGGALGFNDQPLGFPGHYHYHLPPWGEHEEPLVVQSYVWHWHDGEFFLSPICDPDNREECTGDTCAHWD